MGKYRQYICALFAIIVGFTLHVIENKFGFETATGLGIVLIIYWQFMILSKDVK